MNLNLDNEYLCFLDSSSVQNIPNSQRIILDPCDPPKRIIKNGQKFKTNGTGIQGVNCNSCILFTPSTRADEFALILTQFRMINVENTEAQNQLKNAMNNPNLTEDYIKLELASNLSSNYEIINDVNNILYKMLDEEKEDEKIDKMLKRLRRYENKIDINNSRKIHATKRKYLLENLDTTEIKCLMSKEKVLNIILDNYPTHKAVLVTKVAEILNINLIYLPEYSPDLNPIEDVWRVIKDYISRKYLKDVEHLKKLFKEEFYKIIGNPSFYTTWIQKFITTYTQ